MHVPTPTPNRNDDPRKLRELIQKAAALAAEHRLTSVMVGISAADGDLIFPEIVDYVGSALRIDDAIFRMTRERVVFLLTDADRDQAEGIVQRLIIGFHESFTPAQEPELALEFFEVTPGTSDLSVRAILPALFRSPRTAH